MKRTSIAVLAFLVGCTDDGSEMQPPPGPQLEVIPAEPQRAGDPVAGRDYLLNGGYITCGIPKSVFDRVFGPQSPGIDGRTGDNATLPINFSAATSAEGVRVVSANCMQCHAGRINGQLILGLGAADADFTGDQAQLVNGAGNLQMSAIEKQEMNRFTDRIRAIAPYTRTLTVGVNPADNLTAALMSHRDPATLAWSNTPAIELPPPLVVPVDVPPWWRMAKKHSMFYSAGGRGDHARIMMAASLLCTDTVAEAQAIDAKFTDVRAYLETIQPPKWPWAVDTALAAEGKQVFEATCSRCHGTYGEGGQYPNHVVPLAEIETDPILAQGASQFGPRYVDWFAKSFWGQVSRLEPAEVYVPPPLDGIWATAPFLHNGSVPTLAALLDSKTRPRQWTRTFDSADYDQAAVGWTFTVAVPHAMEPDEAKRTRIYDTTKFGYGNQGHTFGDALEPEERTAVLEYLKTL
ncbi:MAG: c-type cytochrome [Myxococcales bacterium]|nr:c-type cytochrome [Myxococcales bacterium]